MPEILAFLAIFGGIGLYVLCGVVFIGCLRVWDPIYIPVPLTPGEEALVNTGGCSLVGLWPAVALICGVVFGVRAIGRAIDSVTNIVGEWKRGL